MAGLSVRLGPLTLANPVLTAAGTAGYGVEFRAAAQTARLGGVVIKTLTRRPREGNPSPRLVETPAGMLNAVGLQNVGIDAFLRERLPALRDLGTAIIVSILDDTPEGLATMTEQLEHADGVSAIELNLSCPNLGGHLMVAQDAEATAAFVRAARARTRKSLWAKLTPDVTDPRPIAQAAERAGADAVVVCNTYTGMSIDPRTRRSRIGSLTGGVSGPAIHPLSLYRAWLVRQAVRCPVIGVGGIICSDDAVEFFLAGAMVVEIGTATFADPKAAIKVLRGLERYLAQQRIASITELVGAFAGAATG
jgi:dihydroorotate dehydrogenase (NAD+) catalytic subunit